MHKIELLCEPHGFREYFLWKTSENEKLLLVGIWNLELGTKIELNANFFGAKSMQIIVYDDGKDGDDGTAVKTVLR